MTLHGGIYALCVFALLVLHDTTTFHLFDEGFGCMLNKHRKSMALLDFTEVCGVVRQRGASLAHNPLITPLNILMGAGRDKLCVVTLPCNQCVMTSKFKDAASINS